MGCVLENQQSIKLTEGVMEKEYVCLSCLTVSTEKEINDNQCPKCNKESLMKTYNASDSIDIPNRNLYK